MHRWESDIVWRANPRIDISPNNILQDVESDSIPAQIEQDEIEKPIARKILNARTIYNSRPMPLSRGFPILCDFGEARIGNQKHRGDIMPDVYRAPEVILQIDWDKKIDIWAIGTMVSPYSSEIVSRLLYVLPRMITPAFDQAQPLP